MDEKATENLNSSKEGLGELSRVMKNRQKFRQVLANYQRVMRNRQKFRQVRVKQK